MLDPSYGSYWRTHSVAFVVGDTTQAKIICGHPDLPMINGTASYGFPAVIVPAITSEVAIPGEANTRQRILQGGARVIDGSISSTDSVAKSVLLYTGRMLSQAANFGGTLSITVTNTISRATGSFLTDGWRTGDSIMPFDTTNANNAGVVGVISTVNSTVITVSGSPYSNETLKSTTVFMRTSLRTRIAVPANSGNTDALPAISLLQGQGSRYQQDPALPSTPNAGIQLGDLDVLIAGLVANTSALPASIQIQATTARY